MIPKFRAWVKPNILSNHLDGVIAEALPNFIYDHCLVLREDLVEDKQFEEILDFLDIEPMQSTGLKDKNGVEIFEGDVVLVNVSNGFDHLVNEKTVVQESEFHSGLVCKSLISGMEYRIFSHQKMGYEYEVTGNIYENSELLEE
ncbi:MULTISPECIES: YopX family protein [Enterococcus]|uniref:YopX family protein n=1 Tax=Enterococcus TaxID=1350 RepID=UPI001E4E3640|nr:MULTISPECIES: YopX family protein [Enterococcus]MCE3183422.1 YopX family protein [Enterococcus faecium]MCW8792420.1 YopX family protein [Enterococcus faecium]MCW8794477.1 YopX family protein [Enterococcus faecium]MDR3761369.1 YopX family protein [Enterococcus sp.]